MQPESNVVRVYRRTNTEPQEIVGVVEASASGQQASFRGLAELSTIISAPRRHLHRQSTAKPFGRLLTAPGKAVDCSLACQSSDK